MTTIAELNYPSVESYDQEAQILPSSELCFRSIVEGSLQGIMIRNSERIEYANAAYAQIFGYSHPRELMNQSWRRLVPAEEAPTHQARGEACLRGESLPAYASWQGIRKDGTRIWLKSTARPFVWKGSPALVALVIDITESKHLADRLQQAQKMETVGRLAGSIAHDFNNLLTIILGYSELALGSLQLNDLQRHAIEQVREAGERASTLAQQLLASSRK